MQPQRRPDRLVSQMSTTSDNRFTSSSSIGTRLYETGWARRRKHPEGRAFTHTHRTVHSLAERLEWVPAMFERGPDIVDPGKAQSSGAEHLLQSPDGEYTGEAKPVVKRWQIWGAKVSGHRSPGPANGCRDFQRETSGSGTLEHC